MRKKANIVRTMLQAIEKVTVCVIVPKSVLPDWEAWAEREMTRIERSPTHRVLPLRFATGYYAIAKGTLSARMPGDLPVGRTLSCSWTR